MDNCVSYYHFEKLLHNQGLDQDANYQDYAKKLYLKGKLVYGDYWTHLKDAWKYKNEKNFKLIWFEDMRADLSTAIRDIAEFTEYQVSFHQKDEIFIKYTNTRKTSPSATMRGLPAMSGYFRHTSGNIIPYRDNIRSLLVKFRHTI